MPAVHKSYAWYERAARKFMPERNSRLGTRLEYGAFLGVLIKKLIEEGMSIGRAWRAVCINSRELGHYKNSENAKGDLESTGSREVCGFCDLANTAKVLAWDDDINGFTAASASCCCYSDEFPLSEICKIYNEHVDLKYRVAWPVFS